MKTINWNQLSELGLMQRINAEILHPLGLAISRNQENGHSESILIADDGVWEFSEEIKRNYKNLSDDEIRQKVTEMISDERPDV